MKATFDAKEFHATATIAKRAIERRNTIPVLGMMRLDFDKKSNSCTIHGNNLDVYITAKVAVETDKSFSVLLNPTSVLNFLRGEVGIANLTYDPAAQAVCLEASGCSLNLRHLIGVEDWPVWSGDFKASPIELSEGLLSTVLKHIRPCISNEATRYYLNGAYFHAVDGSLCVVSTDGHRLAKFDCATDWGFDPAIIPTKTLDILHGLVRKGGNQGVKVQLSEVKSRFEVGDVTIRSKSIDGSYPDYTRVLPAPADDIKTSLSAGQLSKFSDDRAALKISPDEGMITSNDVYHGAQVTVPTAGKGKGFGVKLRYLKEFLKVSPTIALSGKSPNDPFQTLPEDARCLWVLMPMRV